MEPQGLFQLQIGTLWEDYIYDSTHKSQALATYVHRIGFYKNLYHQSNHTSAHHDGIILFQL